jgi:signal transduction histidine kinase
MLKIADEEAARLEELIDNAMDMAQLESERIDVDLEIVDLNEVVREIVSSMTTEGVDRRLAFEPNGLLPTALVDRRLMKLAIKQVVDNALKYSPAGTMVTLRTLHGSGRLTLEITDQGKGIPESEQVHIFERFYRSPSVQDKVPGSGLGLSIARRILLAHKGDLTVRSNPGGTTFSLVVPIELSKEGNH